VVVNPFGRKLSEQELRDLLEEYKPVGLLAGTEPMPRTTLEMASGHLKVISRVGVGWDNVDHDAAKELGIKVLRTEGVLDQAVAELTIGMILTALRNIARHDRDIRTGIWEKYTGSLFAGKKLGIIGYGSIGKKVGELANAFGAEVIFSDVYQKVDTHHARQISFEELIAEADIITVHVSGNKQILGAQELDLCKNGVILVNTSRGEAINEEDLVSVLRSGQVGMACLDVFAREPYQGDLVDMDNVVLTPHIGSYALEARIRMEEMAVENLLQALES
jgi:D-3-phosphoglycerate dehydrogenase